MKTKSIFIPCLIFFLSLGYMQPLCAQFLQRSEFGVFVGQSYYVGDIPSQGSFPDRSFAGGLLYRYNLNSRWTVKTSLLFGKIWGDDTLVNMRGLRRSNRNLRFESPLRELGVHCEFNFFNYVTGSRRYRISPYIFAGLSVFSFDPRATYKNPETGEDETVHLQNIGTEGQGSSQYPSRKPYRLIQGAVPFGIGAKISLSSVFCLGAEWGLRWTFTDYLDDVSTTYVEAEALAESGGERALALSDPVLQGKEPHAYGVLRGNENTRDWYAFMGVTLTVKIDAFSKKSCSTYRSTSF